LKMSAFNAKDKLKLAESRLGEIVSWRSVMIPILSRSETPT
jgi:hypothetical protein